MMTYPDDRQHHAALERIPYDRVAWDAIVASHEDAEVYHTAAWLEFLAATQGAEPVIAVVSIDGRPVGYFVGAIVRRLGVRVLGSPLRGWGTQCMGFLLDDGVDRRAVADALIPFAFHELRCLHVELADRKLSKEHMEGSKYAVELGTSYSIDLTKSEDALLQAMQPKTRQKIRKALRGQLRVDDTTDAAFADEFHAFLTETFARQGIGPTYDVARVRQLIESLHGTGFLLVLRVRSPEGKVLAAGISVGGRRVAVSWGLAMDRSDDDLNPAQLLWWETIRHWRDRQVSLFDMGGGGEYKERYGPVETVTAHFLRSRWPILHVGRTAVRWLAHTRQVIAGTRIRLRSRRVV
jgi:CelD/BcsL family acetyltransferase involved in cellulose biosynthesis